MNLSRVVPLVLVLLAPVGRAADEACLIDSKVFKPQFSAKLPKGFKLVSTKTEKKPKLLKQVLKLPDGFEATVTVGGCEHQQFTIQLKGAGLTTKTVGAELVAIAKRELPTLPMDKDSTVDVKLMIQALDEARINIMPAQLPCGNATCELSLEADDSKPAAKGKAKPKPPPPAKGKKDDKKDDKEKEKEKEDSGEQPGVLKLSYDLPLQQ
jgi:hypothetical protein